MLQLIRHLYRPHRGLVVALLLAALGLSFDGIVQPYVIGHFTDAMTTRHLATGLRLLGLWAIALVFLTAFQFGFQLLLGQNRRALNLDLRQHIAKIALAPANATRSVSQFTAMALNEVKQIEAAFVDALAWLLFCLMQAIVTFTFIMVTNWRLGLLFVGFGLLPTIISRFTSKWLQAGTSAWQAANQRYTEQLEETLSARPLIRTYQLAPTMLHRLSVSLHHSETRYFRMNLRQNVASMLVSLMYDAAFLLPLALGAVLVARGQLTIGALLTLNSAADRVTTPLVNMAQYYNRLVSAKPLVTRVLATPAAKPPRALAITAPPIVLALQALEVGYTTPLTQPLTLTVTAQERLLIQGPSGTGKSTLLATLAGTLVPLGGELMHAANWAQSVALVAQTPFLFHDTLRFNLGLGRSYADPELQAVLHQVGLGTLTPHLDATLGRTERPLSGGELKRLEVARALLAKRSVLLVDEGLSGLDDATAAQLSALFRAYPGTVIEVEHHVPAATRAQFDQVLVLTPRDAGSSQKLP
ncbi:ATP-binding cassette domain-containing protein [Lacticaseibacillus daqingensis]|uniref:ATP-binding cassette domain-containing protein n=1 Tax=Lacticaseibacillus daqingensis TaxID=2486014 RepID=UPI000F7745E6|nr:ABC transporter ATP-binding protein [Lacticaseibacillus daqingensis]